MGSMIKTGRITKRLVILVWTWTLPIAAAAVPGSATFDKMSVGPEIRRIQIETAGDVSVRLEKSAGSIAVSDLQYAQADFYPVSVTTDGDTVRIRVAGNKTWFRSGKGRMTASLRLALPAGKEVSISGGSLRLTGELGASSLDLSAGVLRVEGLAADVPGAVSVSGGVVKLDAALTGAEKVKLSGGTVSGKLRVPGTVSVDSSRSARKVKIFCSAEKGE